MSIETILKTFTESERELHYKALQILDSGLSKKYRSSKMQRAFHAKSTGLVSAELIVSNEVPEELRAGLFEPGARYLALIRFSNGSTDIESDSKRGVRGMSVKILNTGVENILPDVMGMTQDFLLSTNPVLYPGNAAEQVKGLEVLFAKKYWKFISIVYKNGLCKLIAFLRGQRKIQNVLNCTYYSVAPFACGPQAKVKWILVPEDQVQNTSPSQQEDFLRSRLSNDVNADSYVFSFLVQIQQNAESDPEDDTTVEWQSDKIQIGKLYIPNQTIDETLNALDKNIHFSPWHCLPQHRPLGSINKLRLVYTELASRRERKNENLS